MQFVKASPSEFLVVSSGDRSTNRGLAASAFIWPGWSWVRVPATKQEACFEMTQETRDGLPVRFKGIIHYHVEDPVRAARLFDFTAGAGGPQIAALLSHIGLGELRSTVAHLTMTECVEQRKTTLSDAVSKALADAVAGGQPWGIALDLVQVAQVFLVDPELRRELEAEVRGTIRSASQLAELESNERTETARLAAKRRARAEALETVRQQAAVEAEEARLRAKLEADRLASEEPLELARLASRKKLMEARRDLLDLERQVRELEVAVELTPVRARQDLRREILPLEQAPEVARALAGVLAGARVSLIASDASPVVQGFAPLAEYLSGLVKRATEPDTD